MKCCSFNVCLSRCTALLAGIFLLAGLPLLSGCTHGSSADRAFDKLSGKFITSVSRFNKKIMLVPFINVSNHDYPQFSIVFNQNLNARLDKSCPDLLYISDNEGDIPDVLASIPKLPSGNIDNLLLAQTGRQLGLNAIVIGAILNIYKEEKSGGVWLFVRVERSIYVTMNVKIYDTETGTKVLDKFFSRKTKVNKAVYDRLGAENTAPPLKIIEKALIFLAREAGEEICYQMDEQPFKTYVESIDDEKITIKAGQNAGIRNGALLSVFGAGEIINGQGGHRFYIPGQKTGAIKISSVQSNTSEGYIVNGRVDENACLKPQND